MIMEEGVIFHTIIFKMKTVITVFMLNKQMNRNKMKLSSIVKLGVRSKKKLVRNN